MSVPPDQTASMSFGTAPSETGMSDMKRLRGSPTAAAALLPAGPALGYVQRVSAMPGVPTVVVGSAAEQRETVRR